MKKVIILTASTGGGHNAAARSLEDKYREAGFETYLIDIFKETSYAANLMVSEGYKLMAAKAPVFYGFLYDSIDRKDINHRFLGTALFIIRQNVMKRIREIKPDVIVGTHPFAVSIISGLKNKGKIDATFISIITDFKAHWAYVDKSVDAYITGSEYTKQTLVKKNIPEEKVYTYGIPIKEEFLSDSDSDTVEEPKTIMELDEFCRSECGHNDECAEEAGEAGCSMTNGKRSGSAKLKILIMGGSMGSSEIAGVVSHLIESSNKYELTVVCGNNKSLTSMIEKKYGAEINRGELLLFGFTDKVSQLMDECDIIITKPGGLTTSEAIAKNIPMIVPFAIPGQESENIEFLVSAGIAMHVEDMDEIDECLDYLIENKDVYQDMKRRMRDISKGYSLEKIVDLSKNLIVNRRGAVV